MITITSTFDTPVGPITAIHDEAIYLLKWQGINFEPERNRLLRMFPHLDIKESSQAIWGDETNRLHAVRNDLHHWLDEYFEKGGAGWPRALPAMHLEGYNGVQREVYRRLLNWTMPGETYSYKGLGEMKTDEDIHPTSVACALHSCLLDVLIPTHRVLSRDGKLIRYPGGLWRKKYLLDIEAKAAGPNQKQMP